jgi:hypothetical protein
MTVRTMPAKPSRAAGPAGPETELWRGMLWVTWRQHRGVLISVLAMFIAALILMPAAGLKIHHDYATLLACHPATSVACLQLRSGFNTDWHLGNSIRVALLAAPVLLAMFAGPPALARELENGTYRYAWTQGIGRVRWTAAKLALLGSAVTILALVVSQLFTWLFTPFLTTQDVTVFSPAVFDTRGIAYAAWTLTGFCLGAFLGMLLRHVLAAMAATLGVYLALLGVTAGYLHYRYPVRTFWPMQVFEACWLLALSALLVAATIWLVRRHAA